jgi:hypothetical protein
MIGEIHKLVDEYFSWLKDKTILEQVNGGGQWVKIVTPNVDRHNDCIQFYARAEGNGYMLTDDGSTIEDLVSSGCELGTAKRQRLLKMTLAGFGIQLMENDALGVKATKETFSLRKHSLLQAILAVNDLFYLASPNVASLFYEDVVQWMDASEIRYTPKVKFAGKSGYDHMFDFVIPKFRDAPERIVQTVNNPKKSNAESLVFRWLDTKEERGEQSTLYTILNDGKREVAPGVLEALSNYGANPVLWSKRDSVKNDLAA